MKTVTFAKACLKKVSAAVALTGLIAVAGNSLAAPINLVLNGGFEANTGTGQVGVTTTVDHWSSVNGYNFLFAEGTADSAGAVGWGGGPLTLWGAANGGANPLATSANGGYFFGGDGDYFVAPLMQTVNGLKVGKKYALSFEWAAAQQAGYTGATSSAWIVYLAGQPQATSIQSVASKSSSSWMNTTMTFTATSASSLLAFIAQGTPVGEPPFSLLDGVSMIEVDDFGSPVPEPASWLLFGAALCAGLIARRRRPAP